MSNVYYPDYLQLDKILGAQALESDKRGQHAHDEMLFIVIHQAYELWFKQILHEVGSVMALFADGHIDDNAGELSIAVHRLRRRYGELLRAGIAHTVSSPEEIEDEIHHLFRVLQG